MRAPGWRLGLCQAVELSPGSRYWPDDLGQRLQVGAGAGGLTVSALFSKAQDSPYIVGSTYEALTVYRAFNTCSRCILGVGTVSTFS